MGNEVKLKLRVDSFLTNTRIKLCPASRCLNHEASKSFGQGWEYQCALKEVELGNDGQCIYYNLEDREKVGDEGDA
jgi:hypothetical protein